MHLLPSTVRERNAGVLRAHETCLLAANVVLFLLNEIHKSETNLVASECTACYHVVTY